MNPKKNRYSKDHEWICVEGSDTGSVGLTNYAQNQLGDLVYFDLPEPGTEVQQFNKIGEIESVKAVSDFTSPVSGKVLEVNQAAIDEPKIVNEDPYGKGWLLSLELSDISELSALMSSDEYDSLTKQLCEENA